MKTIALNHGRTRSTAGQNSKDNRHRGIMEAKAITIALGRSKKHFQQEKLKYVKALAILPSFITLDGNRHG